MKKLLTTLVLSTAIASSASADYLTDDWSWAGSRLDAYNSILLQKNANAYGYLYNTYYNYRPGGGTTTWVENIFNHAMNKSTDYFSTNGENIISNAATGTASTTTKYTNNVQFSTTNTNWYGNNETIKFGSAGSYTGGWVRRHRNKWINQDVINAWNNGWTGKSENLIFIDDFTTSNGHGTKVSRIASGRGESADSYYVGIAPEATQIKADVYSSTSSTNIDSRQLSNSTYNVSDCIYLYSIYWTCTYAATTEGLKVQNQSDGIVNISLAGYGSSDSSAKYWAKRYITGGYVGYNYDIYFDYLYGTDLIGNKITVISSGNDSRSTDDNKDCQTVQKCNYIAYGIAKENPNTTIVVGALNEAQTAMADYSTNAGLLASNYITAPGTFNANGSIGQGTSYAAPVVSGTAALLKQKFSNLSNPNIVDIIFKTADDDFTGYSSSVYGHGILDIGAAMSPVGNLN